MKGHSLSGFHKMSWWMPMSRKNYESRDKEKTCMRGWRTERCAYGVWWIKGDVVHRSWGTWQKNSITYKLREMRTNWGQGAFKTKNVADITFGIDNKICFHSGTLHVAGDRPGLWGGGRRRGAVYHPCTVPHGWNQGKQIGWIWTDWSDSDHKSARMCDRSAPRAGCYDAIRLPLILWHWAQTPSPWGISVGTCSPCQKRPVAPQRVKVNRTSESGGRYIFLISGISSSNYKTASYESRSPSYTSAILTWRSENIRTEKIK